MKTELWYALVGVSEYPVIYCPCHSAHENTRGKDRHAISTTCPSPVDYPSPLLSSSLLPSSPLFFSPPLSSPLLISSSLLPSPPLSSPPLLSPLLSPLL